MFRLPISKGCAAMSECERCGGNQFYRTSNDMIVQCECISDEAHDAVNRPAYYNKGGVECIAAVKAAVSNLDGIEAHATASALQYLWRWREKNGVEDLRKARWYLDVMIEEASKNSN